MALRAMRAVRNGSKLVRAGPFLVGSRADSRTGAATAALIATVAAFGVALSPLRSTSILGRRLNDAIGRNA